MLLKGAVKGHPRGNAQWPLKEVDKNNRKVLIGTLISNRLIEVAVNMLPLKRAGCKAFDWLNW